MRSAMAVIRANAKYKQIMTEKARIINAFASNPSTIHNTVTAVAKRILLDNPYLLHGRYWKIKAKSLGAGVYELSAEPKNE